MPKIKESEEMIIMSFRIPKPLKKWLEERGKKEGIPYTTMARTLLDRMKYIDEQIKQFDKKRGNK